MHLKRKILIPLLSILILVFALAFVSACAGTEVVPNPDGGSQTEQGGGQGGSQGGDQGGGGSQTPSKNVYDMSAVEFSDVTVPYDGEPHSIQIGGTLPAGVSVSYDGNGKVDAGTYTVTAHFTGDSKNYQSIPDKTATLTIEKADYDMTGITFDGLTVTYDGNPHPLAIKGNLPAGVHVTYDNNNQTTVGHHVVVAHFTGDTQNHNTIPDKQAILIIQQATVAGITFEDETFTYNGEAHSIFIKGDLPDGVNVRYENNGQIDAGEYQVKAIFDTGENYKPIAVMAAKLVIEKADYDMKGITFEGLTVTYDGNPHPLAIKGQLPTDVHVTYDNNDQTTAGEHKVVAHFTGDTQNHNLISDKEATLVIEKATYDMKGITFEGLTVPYDGKTHPLAIQGQLPKDVNVSYENNYHTTAGEHVVIAHFTGDKTNYHEIDDMKATLTIEKIDYDMNGITFPNKTVTYDKQPHPLAIEGNLPQGVYVSYENNSQITAGEHTVTARFTGDANHNKIPTMKATLTVEKRELVIAFEGETEIYYDRNEHKEMIAKPQNLCEGDTVEIELTYSGDMIAIGEYTVTATIKTNRNYQLTTNNTITVSIIERLYKIIFRQEGQIDKIVFVKEGEGLTRKQFPALVEVEGYYFEWEDVDLTTVTDDVIVHATKLAITYIIYYHTGDDVENENPTTYNIETSVELKALKRIGYRFDGWFAEATYDNQVTEIAVGSTGNRNLYAKWELITYQIVYHMPDGSGNTNGNPSTYDVTHSNVSLRDPYCNDGYKFYGWFLDENYRESVSEISKEICTEDGNEIHFYAKMIFATSGLIYSKTDNQYSVTGYTGSASQVVIPELWDDDLPVVSIANRVFQNKTFITSVTIPDGVTSIGEYAFYGCTSLVNVTLPDGVTSIGGSAFRDCTSLESITIPDSVSTIGDKAFEGCTNIKTATMPTSAIEKVPQSSLQTVILTSGDSIGDRAFYGCTGIKSIVIPDGVTSIGDRVFYGCTGLATVYWNATNCETAGSSSYPIFEGCTALTTVYIGENVESIPAYAFRGCTSLESITIPEGVTSVGDWAFCGCTSLESITIPEGVTSVGDLAFCGCTSLANVDFGDNPSLTSIGRNAFDGCTSLASITIPDSVTSIGDYAFRGCTGLESITIPEGVTSIGRSAFYKCTSLESITIPDSVTSIGNYAFEDCTNIKTAIMPTLAIDLIPQTNLQTVILTSGDTIGNDAFEYCESLESITIPESVTFIGGAAFYGCTSLMEVHWNATNCINAGSSYYPIFSRCTALTAVHIGKNVECIPAYAFYKCTSLASVYIMNLQAWCEIDFGGYNANPLWHGATLYLNGAPVTDLNDLTGITEIKRYAFYGCTGLESITIPDSVTSIGSYAFDRCTNIKMATMPTLAIGSIPQSSLQTVILTSGDSIGEKAFYNCISLVSITIPDSVTSIGSSAFSGCTNIKTAIMPTLAIGKIPQTNLQTLILTSGASIGSRAFEGCTTLESITIPKNVTSIGAYAFRGCTSLTSVTITEGATSIGRYAFCGCTGLESITIPESVTSIGDYAFRDCTSLESITISESVTSIGTNAFYWCTSLESVYITNIKAWCKIDFRDSYANPLYHGAALYLNGDPVTDLNDLTGITEIKNYAFYNCKTLTSITLPESVTSIGDQAFFDCRSLESVYITDIKAWCEIDFKSYYSSNPLSNGATLYWNGDPVTDLNDLTGITEIKNYAFYNCKTLTSITLPESVTSIGNYAFDGCTSLASITIPDSVTSIGDQAFEYCASLESIDFGDNSSLTSIGGDAFTGCRSLRSVNFGNNSSLTSIGTDAFYGCTSLESITIPESVTSIGYGYGAGYEYGAFTGCRSLRSVYIMNLQAWCAIDFGSSSANPLYYGATLYLNQAPVTDLKDIAGITEIKNYAFV